uniref:Olfactory receptor n=1 Tax=Xenopus tropicalis TaxID=8364 RepID=A0A803JI32_XENTR
MPSDNKCLSNFTEFLLLGFSDFHFKHQVSIFMFFCSAYVFTLLGNVLVIVTVTSDSRLHTPMYFFLRNLSFIELCFITVTVPKAMHIFMSEMKSISLIGCAFQMLAFVSLGGTECLFLAVMAFDRYVAICNPLRYTSVMSHKTCFYLTSGSWVVGCFVSFGLTSSTFSVACCNSNHILHFFCDITPVLNLACVNTFNNELFVFIVCTLVVVIPFLAILCSYMNILYSIGLIHSAQGRHKAFSTCGSHLVSVILFYGTAMIIHFRMRSQGSAGNDRMIAPVFCILIPAINPLIYSLRNKDVKQSVRKLLHDINADSNTR